MTIGPKGPVDAPKGLGLAKVLQLRVPERTEKVEAQKLEAQKLEAPKVETQKAPETTFESGGTSQTIAAPVEGAGQSQVLARLKALGIEPGRKLTKTASTSGPSIVQTNEGKVLSGSVQIESRQGLQKLTDVVRVGGDLTIHEGVIKNADLLALKSLKSVERRLTFEGLRSS